MRKETRRHKRARVHAHIHTYTPHLHTVFNQHFTQVVAGQSSDSDNTKSEHFAGTLNIFLLAVDPHLNAVTFAYNFTPSKQFLGTDPDDEETAAELKYHTLFTFGSFVIPQFSKRTEAYGTQTRFPNTVTANGIYAYYPTDTYSLKNVPVTCRYSNATDDSDAELTLTARTPAAISPKCSFGLNVRSGIRTTFAMEVVDKTGSTPQNTANGVSYELSLDIVRPFMFRLYPGFVIFAFWLIILFELLLIFSLSFFEFRKVRLSAAVYRTFTHTSHTRRTHAYVATARDFV